MKGIIDSTLREGEQAAYVSFDPAQKSDLPLAGYLFR